jgi:molybdenum cofactor cytidylyltransferase
MEKSHSGVSAILLAAGMSRRMGTPKQLLKFGKNTLLGHVLENVRNSRVDEIILVLGFAAEPIQRELLLEGVKVVLNHDYQEGMGGSLRIGLSAIRPTSGAALIVLADQPFVQPTTLNRLIDYHRQHQPQILVPLYKGFRGNPVLLDRSVFPELMGLAGDIGCRAIFGNHLEGIHKLPLDDMGILLDIDNAEDFEKLREIKLPREAVLEMADLENRELSGVDATAPSQAELVIVGLDAVARALAAFGHLMHFTVTVVDPLLKIVDFAEADRVLHVLDFSRLPESRDRSVVVASRGQFDEEAVEQALRSNAAYVALLANKKRAQEILRSLEMKGVPQEKLAMLRAPAGIDIGAESPEEMALSIMAEIVLERRRHGKTNQKF